MTLNAALWASSTALTGKAALGLGAAALLFSFCDARRITIAWQVLLALAVLLLSIAAGTQADGAISRWSWVLSVVCSCVAALLHMQAWTRVTPTETFSEVAHVDALSKKKKKKSTVAANEPVNARTSSASQLLALSGFVCAMVGVLSGVIFATLSAPRSIGWLSAIHLVAVCVLLAVAIFCALELTFGSAPASLASVAWSRVALVALIAWLAEIGVAAFIVLTPPDASAEIQSLALTRLFAISVLVIDFVVWMIPHRIVNFKRSGQTVQASEWVSLSIAAWLGTLSLLVLAALPSTWPFN